MKLLKASKENKYYLLHKKLEEMLTERSGFKDV